MKLKCFCWQWTFFMSACPSKGFFQETINNYFCYFSLNGTMWSFQSIFSSNNTSKSFMELALSIGLLEMFDWGNLSGMLSHTEFHEIMYIHSF